MQQYKKILGKVMMTAEGTYDSNKGYDPISLITDEETGKSYISRKEVPAGTQINNREYWQPVASSGIIDNGVIILNRKNSDGQIPIYDLKSATEAVAIGDRKGGVILGFLGFDPEIDTVPTWKLYQYNDVSPSNWTNIDYWLPMDYTNKYAGWFDNEEALYDSVPYPKVGMYAYVGNSATSAIIYRCYVDKTWEPTEDKAFGGVVNLADEEDITSKQNKLKFKDKEYNPAQFSGLGKLYLRKNIVDGKNILTQTMIQATNTIYIIQYDYDLQGETITIPEGCTLDFQGGSLNNGTLNLSNTYFKGNIKCYTAISGTIANDEIYIDWFIYNNEPAMFLHNLNKIIGINIINFTSNKIYYIDNSIMALNHGIINISNIDFRGNDCIIIAKDANNLNVPILHFQSCNNIRFSNFTIKDIFNLETVSPNSRSAINLVLCENITIENVTFFNIVQDGVRVDNVTGLVIKNCSIDKYGRNGISLINTRDAYIHKYSTFTGVMSSNNTFEAHCCVDIEPNIDTQDAHNIIFDDCYFTQQLFGIRLSKETTNDVYINIRDCTFEQSGFYVTCHALENTKGNIVFENNIMKNSDNGPITLTTATSANVFTIIKNCTIQNVNASGGTIFESYNVIKIADRGNDYVYTNIGNIVIDGITIIQDPAYKNNIKGIVAGYPNGSNIIENVIIKNITVVGVEFSVDSYNLIYSKLPFGSLKENCFIPFELSKSIASAINPSQQYIINSNTNISLKNSVLVDFGYVEFIPALGKYTFYISNILESTTLTVKYENGTTYEKNDIIYANKVIIQREGNTAQIYIVYGEVIRDGKVIYSNMIEVLPTTNMGNLAWDSIYMRGRSVFNYTLNFPLWFSGGKFKKADGSTYTAARTGLFENKPNSEDIYIGYSYFCTDRQSTEGATDGIMIYHKGNNVWVDALGRVVE